MPTSPSAMPAARNAAPGATGLTGHLENGVHCFTLRVYYEDTDAGGIVYYANYLRFAERARTEMMHLLEAGYTPLGSQSGLENQAVSIAFAVRHLEVDYKAPARLDDLLEVHTTIAEVGGASLRVDQDIVHDGVCLVTLSVRLACIGSQGSPVRLPDRIRQALAGL